jgi:hypothetical protein
LSLTDTEIKQLLPKPPRPLIDGQGYDWKEFDKWLQRLHLLLGTPRNELVYNIPSRISESSSETAILDAFPGNQQQEIRDLSQKIQSVSALFDFSPNYQQQIQELESKVCDINALITFITDRGQEIRETMQMATNAQTLYWMES